MAPQRIFRMLEVKGSESFQKAARTVRNCLFAACSKLKAKTVEAAGVCLRCPSVANRGQSLAAQSRLRFWNPDYALTQTPTNPSTLSYPIVGPLSCKSGSRSRFVFCRCVEAYHRSTPMRTLDNSVTGLLLSPTVNLNLALSGFCVLLTRTLEQASWFISWKFLNVKGKSKKKERGIQVFWGHHCYELQVFAFLNSQAGLRKVQGQIIHLWYAYRSLLMNLILGKKHTLDMIQQTTAMFLFWIQQQHAFGVAD